MKTNRRQLQKEQTRRRLLDIAAMEFASRGIMATRISDIAMAAGVSHGTIFVHFASQEELITAVIEEFGQRMSLRTHELASQCESLCEMLAAHLSSTMEFEGFYTRLILEGPRLPPVARDTFIMIQSAISLHISQAAKREMENGTIKAMPVHLFFNTWVGLIHYYLINHDLFAPGGSVLKRHGPMLLTHFINLVKMSE